MHGSLYVCASVIGVYAWKFMCASVYRCMHVFYVCVDKRSLISILGGASYNVQKDTTL